MKPEMKDSAILPVGLLGILAVGLIDYATGYEIRVYPLYFLPLCLIAWRHGLWGAIFSSVLAATVWVISNKAAGMSYSSGTIWVVNTFVHTVAFVTVGVLVANLQSSYLRAEALSLRDPLTGLPNMRAFREIATKELDLCVRMNQPVMLAFVDLDNFKRVNDTLGHAEGDRVLNSFGDILRGALRSSDLYARVGGDEFVVMMPATGEYGKRALEEIRSRAAENLKRGSIAITASIGAICHAAPCADLDTLIRSADSLMYAVKSEGKNSLRIEVV